MTFVYVEDLNEDNKEFTFTEVDGTVYLQLGDLSADGERLFESIIGGYVGFFRGSVRVRDLEVVGSRGEHGIPVLEIPSELELGQTYRIRSTQSQPGADGESAEDDGSVPLDVTLISKVQIDGLEEHTLSFEYNIGAAGRPGVEWGVVWYGSVSALEAGTPELPADRTPLNVSITPPTLAETEGLHFLHLAFTPQFEGDHYLAFVLDPLPDGQQGEPDMPIFPYLVDADGDWLVDADGDMLVSVAEQVIFLTDADGYQLVDADGNRCVEVI